MALSSRVIKYGFATGRVRVLETKMVSPERVKRLIESETMEEIHRVLAETDYGPEMRSARTIAEIEEALESRLGRAYRLLHESNVPPEMEAYFRSRYDYFNLRALLKRGLGRQADVVLSPLGSVDVDRLESSVIDGDSAGLPAPIKSATDDALAKYREEERVEEIDIVLDKHYFAGLLALAGRLKSKWITAYTKLLIDLANGRVAARAGGDVSTDTLAAYLIPGGAASGEGPLAATTSTADYDPAADNMVIDWLHTANRFTSGPEPVFAYVAAREHEVKLIRFIVLGHISGLPAARIKERVGRVYA